MALDVVLENLHTAWGDEVSANEDLLISMASAINMLQGHVAIDSLKACRHQFRIIVQL
jgi:hypothetical protein